MQPEAGSAGDAPGESSAGFLRPGWSPVLQLSSMAIKEVFESPLMVPLCFEVIVYRTFKASSPAGCDLGPESLDEAPQEEASSEELSQEVA